MQRRKAGKIIATTLLVGSLLAGCGYYEESGSGGSSVSIKDYTSSESVNEVDDERMLDYWKFHNWDNELPGPIGQSKYYITGEDFLKVANGIDQFQTNGESGSEVFRKLIAGHKYDINGIGHDLDSSQESEKWSGSCYGMSTAVVLSNQGITNPMDYYNSETINSINVSKEIFSAINFYHFQQLLPAAANVKADFMEKSPEEQVKKLKNVASEKKAFLLSYNWRDQDCTDSEDAECNHNHGHAVVGFGLEKAENEGQWVFPENGDTRKNYQYRVLIYDCSAPDFIQDETDLYFNEDGSWCIPGRKIYSVSSDISPDNLIADNGKLGRLVSNNEYINLIDYKTGKASQVNTAREEFATLYTNAGDVYKISSSSGSAKVNGLAIFDSLFSNGKKVLSSILENGNGSELEVFLPQGEDEYTITTTKDMDLSFIVGNCLIEAKADEAGTFTFMSDGSVKVECENAPNECQIDITSDADTPFGIDNCNTVSVSAADTRELVLKPSRNGLVVNGENLSDVDIYGYVDGEKNKVEVDSKNESLLLTPDGDSLKVQGDTNGDGTYDTTVNKVNLSEGKASLEISDKTVVYTGKVCDMSIASANGVDEKSVLFNYYKDENCKTIALDPSEVGTYYVRATALNKYGYAVNSNVAKLTIQKKENNIALKNKNYVLKKSKVKKAKQTIKLNATAKNGTVAYKKISGSKNISVLQSGKLVVKKGTKPGTYTVKIRMRVKERKHYKEISKVVTVKVKVK